MTTGSIAILSPRSEPEDRVLLASVGGGVRFVVADGAGGQGGGARAADRVAAAGFDGAPWTTWLERMDLAVMQDGEAGESTAVVGTVVGSRVVGASVGDSEAWIVGLDAVVRLTRDQRRERLGTGRAWAVGFEGTLDEGSTLVVATDGLFRGAASADTVVRAIRDGADAVGLAEVARGASGRLYDDVGVVLIRPR